MSRVKLGLLLRAMREAEGVTQRDSAAVLGYDNATFTCNVEKGASNIPIGKLLDFATQYCPKDRYKMAAAIMASTMPDTWNACAAIFAKLLAPKSQPENLTQEVLGWLESKMDEYGVTF